jgi:RNA polymerase sigma-70 factor (ECF subfamily)
MDQPDDRALEGYRDYLHLLARLQMGGGAGGPLDVSGVVQQTLLEAHQARQRFAALPPEARAAWLRRALANNLADELRRRAAGKRDAARERSLEAALDQSSVRLGALLAADQPSPSAEVQREEQAVALARALARLPEAQREALVLQHWHGWPLARIAEHLGRTRAAVAGLIKRGLQQLREVLPPPE